ncbi:MAG: hypothetical protein WA432_03695 [Candidatus Babeliaceae bacterium]
MTAVRSVLGLIALCLIMPASIRAVSSNNNADPYPLFTAADPHYMLTRAERHCLKGYETYDVCSERTLCDGKFSNPICDNSCHERIRFSASAFRQGADTATDVNRIPNIPIGNIIGRWNVLGVLYPEPDGDTTVQQEVLTALGFSGFIRPEILACLNLFEDPADRDVKREFGFFSVPVKYRKYGARFEVEIALSNDFGFIIEAGVADIKQTATFIDLTCTATGLCCPVRDCVNTTTSNPQTPDQPYCTTTDAEADNAPCVTANCAIDIFNCTCKELAIDTFMKQFDPIITNTINLDVNNFEKISAEDTRFKLFWRHIYDFNERRRTWPHFLFMPFVIFEVTAPTGRKKCENHLFDVPTGNNGHWGIGFTAGFSIDFVETVELVFEGSMTKFTPRVHCNVPVPTNWLQSTVYPRLANLRVKPGTNWDFGITLNAYHFIDRLSIYVQYVVVNHDQNCFSIISSNTLPSNILIDKLVRESRWTAHLINVGLQYDIAPHVALGFLWQAPAALRNAYRSTTLLGSLIFTY